MVKKDYEEEHRFGIIAIVVIVISFCVILMLELEYRFVDLDIIPDDTHQLQELLFTIVIIGLTWLVLLFIGRVFEQITEPKVGSHAQARSMWKLISYAVWALILSILFLGLIGSVSSLAIYIGLIGAALTFVLQKPLLNIGAWVLISYKRIYRIGDRISIGGTKGYVLDITTMYTELREFGDWMRGDTFTGRIVSVPNGIIFDQPVYNYTRDFPFVWDEIGNLVTYESDIEVAKEYMLTSAREVVGDLMNSNYEVYRRKLVIRDLEHLLIKEPELRMELADSGVNLYVLYFCPAESRRKIKSEITEKIWNRFMADPKVGIAYPHMHLVGKLGE